MTGCRTECVYEGTGKRNRETEPGVHDKSSDEARIRMVESGGLFLWECTSISVPATIIDDNTGRPSDCHANHEANWLLLTRSWPTCGSSRRRNDLRPLYLPRCRSKGNCVVLSCNWIEANGKRAPFGCSGELKIPKRRWRVRAPTDLISHTNLRSFDSVGWVDGADRRDRCAF